MITIKYDQPPTCRSRNEHSPRNIKRRETQDRRLDSREGEGETHLTGRQGYKL